MTRDDIGKMGTQHHRKLCHRTLDLTALGSYWRVSGVGEPCGDTCGECAPEQQRWRRATREGAVALGQSDVLVARLAEG